MASTFNQLGQRTGGNVDIVIFRCERNKHGRKHIYESITTEMKYYIQKCKMPATIQEVLPLDTANMLLDAVMPGAVPQRQHQEMLSSEMENECFYNINVNEEAS